MRFIVRRDKETRENLRRSIARALYAVQLRDVAQCRLPPAIGFCRELVTCCTCEGYSRMNAAAFVVIGVAHCLL